MEQIPILLLDDDVLALRHICRMVNWEELGFGQPVCCTRCAQAKEILQSRSIPVCILDIELPGENGLEFGKWVREQYPETIIYILTSYREFHYAQDAVAIGAASYLLKHELDSAQMQELLRNTRARILEQRDSRQTVMDMAFAAMAAGDHSARIPELEGKKLSLFYVHRKYSFTLVYHPRPESDEILEMYREKSSEHRSTCLTAYMPDGLWILLYDTERFGLREKRDSLCASLADLPSGYEVLRTGVFEEQDEISAWCGALRHEAEERFYRREQVENAPVLQMPVPLKTGTLHMQPVLNAWKQRQKDAFAANLHTLLGEIAGYQHRSAALDHICEQLCASLGITPGDERFWSLDELETWLIDSSVKKMDPFADRKLSPITRQILDYCDTHISIRQEELAEALNMSSGHLRTVFKKETGCTISNYILQRQMQHAQYMLTEKRMKATEVAGALGYQSSQYFTLVFRKETGMTPGEYVRQYDQGLVLSEDKQRG